MKRIKTLLGCMAVGLLPTLLLAEMGQAKISGTKEPSAVNGIVKLEDTKDGLKIVAEISQAPAGQHAFHIHEFGGCGDEGKAAGSHYNPAGHTHGNVLKDGIGKTHAGDFGNITIGPNGKGTLEAVVPGLTLSQGKYSVSGRAFILHEKPDDFSQPVGNAGARIGCGPIILTKE